MLFVGDIVNPMLGGGDHIMNELLLERTGFCNVQDTITIKRWEKFG